MSFEAQRIFLSAKVAQIAVAFPIKIPGQKFKKPTNAPYGEFFIMGTKPFVVGGEGKGRVRHRYAGMVQLDIYLPEDTGTTIATRACDAMVAIFQHKLGRDAVGCTYNFKGAEVLAPRIVQNWDVFTVRVPFTRDEVVIVQISAD